MRILLIADPMIPVPPIHYGGVERLVDMLINQYVDRGHEVMLVGHPDSRPQCPVAPLHGLDVSGRLDTLRNTLLVRRVMKRFRPDVVHSFGRMAYMTAIMRSSIPKIMSYGREPTLKQIARAVRLAKDESLIMAACADHIADKIRTVGPVETVYNGVPAAPYTLREDVAADAPLVFLGRIEPIKGTDTAIRVARRSGRKLIIAGNVSSEGGGERYFEEDIRPHIDGDTIEYVGPVDDRQKNEILGQGAALLMPINIDEPFGMVMAEALACGTPVIGLRRGAVPEVVIDGVTGYVCDTEEQMVEATSRMGHLSREACRADFERRFSDAAVADAYTDLYVRRIAAIN